MSEKLAYSVKELAAAASVGRSSIYKQIQEGRLRPIKIGDRTIFPIEEVRRWLAASMPEGAAA